MSQNNSPNFRKDPQKGHLHQNLTPPFFPITPRFPVELPVFPCNSPKRGTE